MINTLSCLTQCITVRWNSVNASSVHLSYPTQTPVLSILNVFLSWIHELKKKITFCEIARWFFLADIWVRSQTLVFLLISPFLQEVWDCVYLLYVKFLLCDSLPITFFLIVVVSRSLESPVPLATRARKSRSILCVDCICPFSLARKFESVGGRFALLF